MGKSFVTTECRCHGRAIRLLMLLLIGLLAGCGGNIETTLPAIPTGLAVRLGDGQVVLTWTASARATSYRVSRATASGGAYTQVGTPTATTYTNAGLANGTTYYFVVTAVNAAGESAASNVASATPHTDPMSLPLLSLGNLEYLGAFGIPANYSPGTIGYNPTRNSLFIAGHAQQASVGEFAIPELLVRDDVRQLNWSEQPLQDFADMVGRPPEGNPEGHNRIDGLLVVNGQLIVNTENWYDAGGTAQDTTVVVRDATNLRGVVDGYFELAGRAHAGGYMAPIPAEWQPTLGATHLTGWSAVTSIIARHSIGPSLFTFDPSDITGSPQGSRGPVETTAWMDFPYAGAHYLGADALTVQMGSAPALWNFLSGGTYGFIVPGTRTFAVFGHSSGIDSGIGYKVHNADWPDGSCGGYCAYDWDDHYNYYWFFDLTEIVGADQVWNPRPYAYGRLSLPFDRNGRFGIGGGAYDAEHKVLYLALGAGAGQRSEYDRPPLILGYRINLPPASE